MGLASYQLRSYMFSFICLRNALVFIDFLQESFDCSLICLRKSLILMIFPKESLGFP